MLVKVFPHCALLLAVTHAAAAQNIYKCTHGGRVEFTDQPCSGPGELIHKADHGEVIDRFLNLGQLELAQRYAESHRLEALYQERLSAHEQRIDERKEREEERRLADERQREELARQQLLAAEAEQRDRLEAENDALRRQNDEYLDQLAQPPPNAWGVGYPYPYPHPDHPRPPHRPPPIGDTPIYHPCRELAGGRIQC